MTGFIFLLTLGTLKHNQLSTRLQSRSGVIFYQFATCGEMLVLGSIILVLCQCALSRNMSRQGVWKTFVPKLLVPNKFKRIIELELDSAF